MVEITKSTPIKDVLKEGEVCDKSGHCCKFMGGFVIKDDIKRLAKHFKISEEKFIEKYLDEHVSFNTKHHRLKINKHKDKPYGPCVFLGKDNLCTIHEIKPLHCKIGSCCHKEGQKLSIWFALNHFVNPNDPESIRQWAVYLKSQPTIPGGQLHELVPDKKQLKKILEYEIFNEKDLKKENKDRKQNNTKKDKQTKNKQKIKIRNKGEKTWEK